MRWRVPLLGFIGDAQLKEAAAGSYQQLFDLLHEAIRKLRGTDAPYWHIQALFPDTVVLTSAGKMLRYTYAIGDDLTVTLTNPIEVEETYQPKNTTPVASRGSFVEAVGEGSAGKWKVRVIKAGTSGNGNIYTDKVLRESLPKFDGVRVFVKSDEEHLKDKGKDVRNLIGRLVEPAFVEGASSDQGEIQAVLQLIEPEGAIAVKLREAGRQGMLGLFGLSIDARGPARRVSRGGQTFVEALGFTKVLSVDLIVEPGAGGGLISFIEATSEERHIMNREQLIKLLEASRPDLLKGKDVTALTDDQLQAIFTEALGRDPISQAAQTVAGTQPAGVTKEELNATVRMVEARAHARTAIAASTLPDAAKTKLRQRFEKEVSFTEADVDQAIKEEREYVAGFTESGKPKGVGDGRFVEAGETRGQKVNAMLDAFFDREHKDHKFARSFRECYIEMTGDRQVTGLLQNCDEAVMRESLEAGTFANVLGNAITRRMVADYRSMGQYDIWRRIAVVVPVNDFRTQERTRYGGYGDLPIVAEKGAYANLTSPTDEKSTYAVAKRGGVEDITLEMIKNDDVGAVQRVPTKLSRAAKRTLGKFVLDFIRTNPAIYDTVALFHATHGNLASATLDATSLAAGRVAMLRQKEKDSNEELGIGPRSLLVPPELENAAVDLFRRSTNNDQTFIQSLALDVIPVWYWTDVNDWALAADPNDIPGIEIGFLDGQEEPQLFVQDDPRGGSMFSNDKLTWKIRHIYGGSVIDFRGFFKSVVA